MKLFRKDKEAILDRIDQVEIALMRKINMVKSDREKSDLKKCSLMLKHTKLLNMKIKSSF